MSTKLNRQTVVGIALLALLLVAVVWALRGAFAWFQHLSPNVAAALVTAAAAIAGLLYTQKQNKAKDIAEAHRSAKVEAYKNFMEFITRVMVNTKGIGDKSSDEVLGPDFQREFMKFTSDLVIWGSPDVLHRYGAWRSAAQQNNTAGMILAFDDLLRSIRADLRNNNKTLKRGDLMKLYLRDPDELAKATQAPPTAGFDIPDEAAMFIATYGPPTEEICTQDETPRPPIVTRWLVYRPENVRVIFIPFGSFGAPPPYSAWKFFGAQDAITDSALSPTEAAERLKKRKKE